MKANEMMNKDLILRENLAIERTRMANDRTFLSFIRTSLYFAIAGMTVNSLLKVNYGWFIEIVLWISSFLILLIGTLRFFRQKKNLENNRKHIGNFKLEKDEN